MFNHSLHDSSFFCHSLSLFLIFRLFRHISLLSSVMVAPALEFCSASLRVSTHSCASPRRCSAPHWASLWVAAHRCAPLRVAVHGACASQVRQNSVTPLTYTNAFIVFLILHHVPSAFSALMIVCHLYTFASICAASLILITVLTMFSNIFNDVIFHITITIFMKVHNFLSLWITCEHCTRFFVAFVTLHHFQHNPCSAFSCNLFVISIILYLFCHFPCFSISIQGLSIYNIFYHFASSFIRSPHMQSCVLIMFPVCIKIMFHHVSSSPLCFRFC